MKKSTLSWNWSNLAGSWMQRNDRGHQVIPTKISEKFLGISTDFEYPHSTACNSRTCA